jgi:UPF0176 protein
MVPAVVNLSAYLFSPLTGLPGLRERLKHVAGAHGLKGTILLAPEGINLFVAGGREAVDTLVAEIRSVPGLESLAPKESLSEVQPFRRMLVKIKREIIAFGVDGVDPSRAPAPRLEPATLRSWLDEGREIVLLDTRNVYEVAAGTFHGAVDPGIRHFRDFPQTVARLPEEWKDRPVVTFCTGGIRCEKAAPYLLKVGFKDVWQLDGGILKYFEHCGGAHYDGACFVFDEREGVDPGLRPAGGKTPSPSLQPRTSPSVRLAP